MATHGETSVSNILKATARSTTPEMDDCSGQNRSISGESESEKGASAKHSLVNKLVVKLLPLVRRVALPMRERLPGHVEMDDLISLGTLGLVDAVKKFDAKKQVRLELYAQYRIRGAILDGLREMDHASRDMRRKNKNAEKVYLELESSLGRPPSDQEMAQALGISLKRWYQLTSELKSVGIDWLRPLAAVGTQEPAAVYEDSLPADNAGHQFEECYDREKKEILQKAMGRIPDRERQVIDLYYHQGQTMREIGDRLGIDESRVSQLHSSALGRLRKRVKEFLTNPIQPEPRFAW